MAGLLQSMLAACLLLALFAGADAGTRRTSGTMYGYRPPHCVRGFLCNSDLRPLASSRCLSSCPVASSYGAERELGAARGRGGRESSYKATTLSSSSPLGHRTLHPLNPKPPMSVTFFAYERYLRCRHGVTYVAGTRRAGNVRNDGDARNAHSVWGLGLRFCVISKLLGCWFVCHPTVCFLRHDSVATAAFGR
jgi:hypothetical protein